MLRHQATLQGMDISWPPALFWRYLQITGKVAIAAKFLTALRSQHELERLAAACLLACLLACCRREVKHIPTTRPHGDMEGYRQMLVMCMRCYTRVDMVKQCNRKAFARVRIKTGITSEANLPQAMALQGETANREILTWSLISLYAITERARTTKTGILDNRRIMSLSNFLQFIPLQGVWPPRTSVRFP